MREQARLGHTPEQWNTELPRAAFNFAGHFGNYLDAINDKLDAFFSTLVDKPAGAAANAVIAATGAARFREVATTSMVSFKAMTPEHRHLYVRLLRIVLTHPGAWLTGNALRGMTNFKEALDAAAVPAGETDDYVCRVGALLSLTTLGSFQVSNNKSGPRNFFFLKRQLEPDQHMVHVANILRALGCRVEAYKGHTLEHLRAHKPKTAADPSFPALPAPDAAARLLADLQAIAA